MIWEVCIQYPNGKERILCSHKQRETALKHIDAIYASGYPMHVAYIVRQASAPEQFEPDIPDTEFKPGVPLSHLQPA